MYSRFPCTLGFCYVPAVKGAKVHMSSEEAHHLEFRACGPLDLVVWRETPVPEVKCISGCCVTPDYPKLQVRTDCPVKMSQ